jgi:DNA-binding transcriptional regulator YiaG
MQMTFEYPERRTFQGADTALKKLVADQIDRLFELAERTDPELGADPHRKDARAFDALRAMSWLCEVLAGWAVDHGVGLALEGRQFLVNGPQDAQKLPGFIADRAEVDSHRHEIAGRNIRRYRTDVDAQTMRLAIHNVLRTGIGGLPPSISISLTDAIEALELGEVQPLLKAKKSSRKVTLRQLRLQLQAISFIAFRQALGASQFSAIEDVANAYGVSFDTVRGWEPRVRKALGSRKVDNERVGAKNAASYVALARKQRLTGQPFDPYASTFGSRHDDAALAAVGLEYRSLVGRADEHS